MKNKQTVTMVAAISILIVAAAVYLGMTLWNRAEADKADEANASIQLLDMSADEICRFSYEYNGTNVIFVWEDGLWYLEEDRNFPVNQTTIEGKLSSVASTTASREFEISQDRLADYGLDHPVNTISVTDNEGHEKIFEIGGQNSTSGEYYCRLDQTNTVYMISASLNSMMSFDIYTVADMSSFPVIAVDSVRELTVDDGKDVKILDSEEDASAFSAISSLYYTSHVDYNCTDMAKYGLDTPEYIVTVKYAQDIPEASDQGETDAEQTSDASALSENDKTDVTTVVLYIGSASDNGYYVRLENSNEVHTISSDTVTALTQ